MAVQLVLSGDTRFGTSVVHRANDLAQPRGVGLAPTLDFLDARTRG
jgi:hypothetical protein